MSIGDLRLRMKSPMEPYPMPEAQSKAREQPRSFLRRSIPSMPTTNVKARLRYHSRMESLMRSAEEDSCLSVSLELEEQHLLDSLKAT